MNIYDLGFDSSKKTPAIIKARVIEMHKKHGSMLKEDAMLEYVKIVENIFPYRFFIRNGSKIQSYSCENQLVLIFPLEQEDNSHTSRLM